MKVYCTLAVALFACLVAGANVRTYVGSTPAHAVVREFLQISLTDSIDFIRWKLQIGPEVYRLQCRYGLAQPGTPGFSNERTVAFEGPLARAQHHYSLKHRGRDITILEVNANVLHFLDRNNGLLVGNGGYSYALNSTDPVATGAVHLRPVQAPVKGPLVFEGRTPCRDLPALLGLSKSEACNKMKWYFLFYTDSATGAPSHFLMGGMGYRKETMARGRWQIVTEEDGRIFYRVYFDQWVRPLNLLKGDDNILFFTGADGRLLVGNEDFSYTLNRRSTAYAPVNR